MKKLRNFTILAISALVFINCQNRDYDNFFETEKTNLVNTTREILEKLSLDNFEILAYSHKGLSNRVVSKQVYDTKYSGENILPILQNHSYDEISFPNLSVSPVSPVPNGWFEHRSITANYEPDSENEITYKYISIIIIFENISNAKKNELLKILNSYITDVERGDSISILSKEEFNKL